MFPIFAKMSTIVLFQIKRQVFDFSKLIASSVFFGKGIICVTVVHEIQSGGCTQ